MFRAIAISLALLVGVSTIIPLATDLAEAGPRKPKAKKKPRGWRGVKKYSKRWWQLYRAQERRKKLRAKQTRSLRLRQLRLATARAAETGSIAAVAAQDAPAKTAPAKSTNSAVLPSGEAAPKGWRSAQVSPAELQFRVDNSAGDQVGSAAISVVGPAMSAVSDRKTLAGVATSSLRREIIDRMIRENGWVVNDYQQTIAGQPVYVVVAQSQARGGSVNQRMFYFTEVDGRIYSVATNSPVEEATRLAEESEKVINSLKSRVRPAQRASN